MHLIIQSRTDQSGWHELKCIFQASGLRYNDILVLNMGADFVTSEMLRDACKKADSIIIGGLGEVGYGETNTEKSTWFNAVRAKILPVLADIIEADGKKILGICLGHQLLAEALNALVLPSSEQTELGITQIALTPAGQKDPIFSGMPVKFLAIEGHRDAVITKPRSVVHLAYSQKCPIQAFRYKKYIYGVQFHPELNIEDYSFRTSLYSAYSENASNNKTTPKEEMETHLVIKNFLKLANPLTPKAP